MPKPIPALAAILTAALILPWTLASPMAAASFPPISDAERSLTEVSFEPEANAVVLFQRAELRFMDYPKEISSFLEIRTRIKILREEGMGHAEVELPHSKTYRLKSFEGRTILPDGREIPLSKDAVFRERRSRAEGIFVTKAAFPGVEVGAILDLHYVFRWDSILHLEPFFFADRLPTLEAEIVYDKPSNLGLKPWGVEMGGNKFEIEQEKSQRGNRLTVRMRNLPGIPEESRGFPFEDLSSRFMMLPGQVLVQGSPIDILETWKSVCDLYQDNVYGQPRSRNGKAKKKARELITGKSEARAKAEALYTFVRDEIQTYPNSAISAVAESGVDKVLSEKVGTLAEKALLLEVMLKSAKLEPRLVWASRRSTGRADLSVPNPWWFDRVLVSLELEGKRVFLDPSEQRLGFGKLAPDFGGSQALVVDRKNPQVVDLPLRSFASNLRQARLQLELDQEGEIAGTGTLSLNGHHAFYYLRWKEDAQATQEAWGEWLEDRYEDFEISKIEVEEQVEEQWITVRWAMTQREELILGDEASLLPSRPFGPVRQRFSLPPEQRKTPVLFALADRDTTELTLTWPEGWEIDVLPEAVELKNAIGATAYSVAVDAAARTLTYTRRFDLRRREVTGAEAYKALRDLYANAEKHDAQTLAFLRP